MNGTQGTFDSAGAGEHRDTAARDKSWPGKHRRRTGKTPQQGPEPGPGNTASLGKTPRAGACTGERDKSWASTGESWPGDEGARSWPGEGSSVEQVRVMA